MFLSCSRLQPNRGKEVEHLNTMETWEHFLWNQRESNVLWVGQREESLIPFRFSAKANRKEKVQKTLKTLLFHPNYSLEELFLDKTWDYESQIQLILFFSFYYQNQLHCHSYYICCHRRLTVEMKTWTQMALLLSMRNDTMTRWRPRTIENNTLVLPHFNSTPPKNKSLTQFTLVKNSDFCCFWDALTE